MPLTAVTFPNMQSPPRRSASSSARAVSAPSSVTAGLTPVRVRGILLHPQTKGTFQWAQVWVAAEAEVKSLLGLRDALAVNGM